MDYFDDLLARSEALRHLGTDGTVSHPAEQGLSHRHRDVGLEKGEAHLPQRLVDIGFRKSALAAKTVEDAAKTVCQ
jgi:hypothetical protein